MQISPSAYDNMGRLVGTSTQYTWLPGLNFQNAYTYDAASNRTSLTAPDGSVTTYGAACPERSRRNTLSRLNGMANSWAGSFGFSYDALSRRTQLTRPNGINTNYGYDAVSHLLSVLHQTGTTTLDGAAYTYDSAGNRLTKTNYLNGVTSNYGYDLLYELTQVTQGGSTTESYSYDTVGNRLSSSGVPLYNYNSSNELTSNSNGSYTYDANGNTLTDASGKTYTWDFENRLSQAVVPGQNGGTTTFKYDPFGRRIQKSGPLGTTNYLYDGKNLLEELDGAGSALARYTQSSGIDKPLAQLSSGTVSYYQQDALGSVTSLSNSAGALANTYSYDSFGRLTASTGTLTNPFQYAGREFDPETGIYENRFRYYNQSTGRFISEDPVGFLGGINKYAYVLNMPTNFSDPSGLDCPENPTDCVHSPDERAQMQRDHDATMQRILGPDVPDNGPNRPPPPPASNCKNRGKGDCASAYAETAIGGAWIVGWVAVDAYLLLPAIYEEGVAEGTMLAFGHGAATLPGVGGVLMYLDGIGNITANCPLLVDWFLGD